MSVYPEHEKMRAVRDKSQACGEFVEWLGEVGIFLCSIDPDTKNLFLPIHERNEAILARYFGIDLGRIGAEKDAMLEEIRSTNQQEE